MISDKAADRAATLFVIGAISISGGIGEHFGAWAGWITFGVFCFLAILGLLTK